MSRPDSERALEIYKTFTAQTEEVVKFLGVARHFQSATRLEIPKLKHASTDLTRLLEDDLNDPDFNIRRREYLARKGAKNGGADTALKSSITGGPQNTSNMSSAPSRPQTEPNPQKKTNPADLIDFFEPIEPNPQPTAQPTNFQHPYQAQQQQQTMPSQPTGFQPQQTGLYTQQTGFQQQPQGASFGQPTGFGEPFPQQNNNQFGQAQAPQPLQSMPTGAGFGGYSAQPQTYGFQTHLSPIPQSGVASFSQQQQPALGVQQQPQQQSTNPFRQSMLMSTPTGTAVPASPLSRQNTNPFARRLSTVNPQVSSGSTEGTQSPAQQPLRPHRTGTNPFARSSSVPPQQSQGLQPPAAAPLRPNPTGSTNPFRQSAFVNQQTGQGWHVGGQQGTMGGLEKLETVPVFPRPGMA